MTKTLLVDVNVWIALLVDSHLHHPRARAWAAGVHDAELAFCRVTQHGLLRLLTNRKVMADFVLSLDQAWMIYDQACKDRRAVFLPEPDELENQWRRLTRRATVSQNVWTDAYLAAFAMAGGYEIITFDRGFAQFNLDRCTILA